MFLRIDKLQANMPLPKEADPNAAAAIQELLGGKVRRDVDLDELHAAVL
jgi:Mn-containing catalase